MKVLGIHDGHNASVCLVEDGKIMFAIQEERLVYEKNKSGFPINSVKHLLKLFNLKPTDIDHVAIASHYNSVIFADGTYLQKHTKSTLRRGVEYLGEKTPLYKKKKEQRKEIRLKQLITFGFPKEKVTFVDHHECHAATAYYGSHFPRNEKVLVLTNDASGDGLCATVSVGEDGKLRRIASVPQENSFAAVYALITRMLGFKPLEHEYKLMGIAPYSSPKGQKVGYAIFKDLIEFNPPYQFKRTTLMPTTMLIPYLQKQSRFIRFDWVCAGLQQFTEEAITTWVNNCIQETGIKKVALAGGIFMNVKANKKILDIPEIEDIFVFPSCSDETISIGAAYWVYNEKRDTKKANEKEIEQIKHFYLGDSFTDDDAIKEIQKIEEEVKIKYKKCANIEKDIAKLLAKKKVVARCKGSMEFGARALGNRSLLADPAELHCVREINMMIKKRDFWMPFAPVMRKENEEKYIINKKKVSASYMIITFDTTNKRGDMLSAIHQADFTARPQIVEEEQNPEYYAILKEFEKITKRGVLLNTSFNLHGFPIVHGPKEALDVFKKSGLQYLALGNFLIEKMENKEIA
jgi:carbamoyltransferase